MIALGRVLLGAALLAGCAAPEPGPVVFAAASTGDVVRAAAPAGAVVSVAASSVLARQIARGAPAAVFVSADPEWVDWLAGQGLEALDRRVVAEGQLVVVGARGTRRAPSLEAALDGVGRVALADPAHVPAGRYARRALERAGLWGDVEARVVGAGDVRAALAAVETGAADRAVVYATDARASARVAVVAVIPPDPGDPIRTEAALLTPEGRGAFEALVEARGSWADAGFLPPTP